MERSLGSHFITHIGKADSREVFSHDLIVLYFCAHWAPPCRDLTPLLTNVYRSANEAQKRFEVICISFDRDNETFYDYFDDMPWIAVPFGDTERCKDLAAQFRVIGVPMVIVLNREAKVLTSEGRGDIYEKGPGAVDHWFGIMSGAVKAGPVPTDKATGKPEESKARPEESKVVPPAKVDPKADPKAPKNDADTAAKGQTTAQDPNSVPKDSTVDPKAQVAPAAATMPLASLEPITGNAPKAK
jgi:nucleoredoxin